MELRKYPRFAVQLPVSYMTDDVQEKGMIFNLSAEGCAIGSNVSMPAGTYLSLQLYLTETSAPVEVDLGAVRWSTEHQFGVEFIRLGQQEQERVRAYARELRTEG
jgi:hypothetical protein